MKFLSLLLKALAALLVAGALVWLRTQHIPGLGGHPPAEVPSFTLTDHLGHPADQSLYLGRHGLIYFGYTYCPDICPTSLTTLTQALSLLGKRADRIAPVFITVDPQRDTPIVLADYLTAFTPGLTGLTGTPEQIQQVARQFGVIYSRHGDGTDYVMDHSASLYLMTPDGHQNTIIPHGTSAEKLAMILSNAIGP